MLLLAVSIIGSALILLGLAGCFLPILPGPPLSFVALFMLALVQHFSPPLTPNLVIMMALFTIAVVVLDYVIPSIGAKRYGSSKWGIWGSIAGMLIGIFYFPPFGMIAGAFIGAVIGELLFGKRGRDAFRAGQGILIGVLLGVVLKLAASGTMTYYFVQALF